MAKKETRKKSGQAKKYIPLYIFAGVALILAVAALLKLQADSTAGISEPNPPLASGDELDEPEVTPPETVEPEPELEAPDEAALKLLRDEVLAQADTLKRGYFYDEAIALLQENPELENEETAALAEEIQQLKGELVLYDDPQLYHIFFHSLIVDTSKAFDGDYYENGYNMYMATTYEFKKMLPLLLENDFVLYDIREMTELKDGKYVRKDIYLPQGKKPLVISIDDVNYYNYMVGDNGGKYGYNDGFALRLDVDAAGNIVTILPDENGGEVATYDGDVMPILDVFVKEYPEFSWRGAKGIVAITGYEGAFGYRIQKPELLEEDEYARLCGKVTEVAEALYDTGWSIACHSFTHNDLSTRPLSDTEYDMYRWNEAIAPFILPTNIFISPYGFVLKEGDERLVHILNNGFSIYCPVGSNMVTWYKTDYMLQERLNIDGLTMLKYPERISKHFFDPAEVLDPSRPPLE